MDEFVLTLNSPITDEQWDLLWDVNFERTDRISFHTKNGNDVEFVKQGKGKWIKEDRGGVEYTAVCSECGYATFWSDAQSYNYCPACGIKLKGED